MDARLDENKTKLRVLVLSIPLKMLANSDGLVIGISINFTGVPDEVQTFLINM